MGSDESVHLTPLLGLNLSESDVNMGSDEGFHLTPFYSRHKKAGGVSTPGSS